MTYLEEKLLILKKEIIKKILYSLANSLVPLNMIIAVFHRKPKEKLDVIISDYCLLTQINYCISKAANPKASTLMHSHISHTHTNVC